MPEMHLRESVLVVEVEVHTTHITVIYIAEGRVLQA